MKKNTFIYIVLCAIGFIACDPDFDQELEDTPIPTQESGTADFSNYVALGNSLTAGFTDGALFRSGQEASFPNILATQMQAANGNQPFNIPFMTDDVGGFAGFEASFQTRFVFDAVNQTPVRLNNNVATNDITARVEGPFNNFGVPGITSFQLGFGGLGNPAGLQTTPPSANPYFARFASSPTASILGDALATNPTFFTLWLGSNDILGYAISGGTGVNQTGNPDPSTYGPNDITDPAVFAGAYQTHITTINAATTVANGTPASGVVINIPSVTDIPFFTTVPYNPIPLDQETADQLNASYAAYNEGIAQAMTQGAINRAEAELRTINFTVGQNAPVIIDEFLNDLGPLPKLRQAQEFDLIVLPASSFIGTLADENNPMSVNGLAIPLADEWVLTSPEISQIETARIAYNETISDIARNNDNIALFNVSRRLAELQQGGVDTQELSLNADFVTGGAFSLDGVHLSPRGYAVIANDLIEVINRNFNSTLQPANVAQFRTVTLQ